MLPDEILEQLNSEYPCRESQIQQLAALYNVCADPMPLPVIC
jgi:origin recognition complex subunit 5